MLRSVQRVVVILGPTAVGKTEIGMELAVRWGAEIISADSSAVYRGLDIGSAKPTPEEQQRVRFHLIDVVDPSEVFTAARFRELALQAIEDIQRRGKRVLIVGGTGLYIRVLLHGFSLAPPPADPEIRARWRAEVARVGAPALHERLRQIDPVAAARIHPNDAVRITRALEVYEMTGIPISQWQQRAPSELPALKIGLTMPRELLYRRIDERVDKMIAQGMLQEVQQLLQKGYNPEQPALKGLGYRHLIGYIQGCTRWDEAVRLWKRDTRRFAKRQMTWFRKEPGVHWIDASRSKTYVIESIEALLMEQGGLDYAEID
ncbi:MAG: tRNA (adenosine(37)-N6)-dimethylallyltransferase MiaA [Armatimonadota bacterium]|nr:tRNA (adenosine(37)-N6)-dimethylallyltransferase MiaA [Armatimonadota bacterium]